MQPLTRCWVLLSLLAFLCTGFAPGLAAQTSTVRCEAPGRSQTQCPIPSNAQVRLARTLSQEACREGHNWGVGTSFIWVNGGCRAEFAVTSTGYETGPGYAHANPNQLRACRSEADRRLAAYSYDQISVEADPRQGNIAYVRWWVGPMSGLCAVTANGRVLQFTTNPVGIGGATTRVVCESRYGRDECRVPAGARIRSSARSASSPAASTTPTGRAPSTSGWTRGAEESSRSRRRAAGAPDPPGGLRLVAQHAPAVRDSSRRAGAARPPDERGAVPHGPELGCGAGVCLGGPRVQRGVRGDGAAAEGKAATAGARA